jgi:hypothetical protein
VATLPPGLPVWLRWTLAAPILAVAVVGPILVALLVSAAGFPDRGDRTLIQAANNVYGSAWFVFAFLVPGVIAAAFLWRQMLAWRKVYVITVSVVVGLWTVSDTLFDATDRDATQPWIVPVGVDVAAWLGGYLLAMGAIRILTTPGARLADSSMEMVVPMRARPGKWPRHRGWIRLQWDRVRIEAGGSIGTAIMAWWAIESVQAGDFTGDSELRVTEFDSDVADPRIPLPAGAGVRMHGTPGTLFASCADGRAALVAEAIAARVAWASRRPWTEGPDFSEADARAGYEEGRDTLRGRFMPMGIVLKGPQALVALSVLFILGTGIGGYLTARDARQHEPSANSLKGDTIYTVIVAALAVYAVYLLWRYLRSQRFLEANVEPVPGQPATPWLARAEPIVVRPDVSEDPDQPFVRHKPVRSAQRARRRHDRRRR